MGAGWLIVMMLQAAPSAPPPSEWSARLSAGVFGGYLLSAFGDDSAYGGAAGAEVSVPVWTHTNIDARVMRWFPGAGYGFYDLRLRQTLGPTRGAARKYVAAGLAGTVDDQSAGWDFNGPELFSAALGAEIRAGRHAVIPIEVSGMGSFRNAGAFVVSAGVKWASPRR